jgi:PEP-CTERM motif
MNLPLFPPRFLRALRFVANAVVASAALSANAHAAIDNGSASNGEFVVVIWDQANEASYALDLGVTMTTLQDVGQQDEGYQRFWNLDRTLDARLDKLLDGNTALSDLRWAVLATDSDGSAFEPGSLRLFFTLEHTVPTGTLNPNYTTVSEVSNLSFEAALGAYQQSLINALNNDVSNTDNTHGTGGSGTFANNGSSYTAKGQSGYFDNPGLFLSTFADSAGPAVTNKIGSSSWFYFATSSSFDSTEALALDEFDNLTHDGFWGLTLNPADNTLALSYTIEGTGLTLAQRTFAQSIGRTELNGGFTMRRLSGVAANPMEAGNGFSRRLLGGDERIAITVVPEPSSWLLMGLGLGVVGWLARRRG